MSVDWSEFDKFGRVIDMFMPSTGEGETKASQLVTAVNNIIYRWYNDGDVYDNTGYLSGGVNDISSFANWIYKYIPSSRKILDRIFECYDNDDYEDLLMTLAENTLDAEDVENLAKVSKVGSIYNCSGPFEVENDSYEHDYYNEQDDSEEEDDYYEEDDDIESSVDITAAEDEDVAPTKDEQFDELLSSIKDDYDLLLSGIDKLRRNGASTFSEGYNIAKQLSDNLNELISAVGERF